MSSQDLETDEREHTPQWIVGVDGSKGSEHALRWSVSQAGAQSAAIRVVCAGEQAALDELESAVGEVGPIEWTSEPGNPSITLLRFADAADLLVLGTRGLGGFKRLLLGSVSQQCAVHARVPVVVVPESASLTGQVDRIVVGMDGSANAKEALRWALDFARPTTTVHVVGAWEPSSLATEADRQDFDYLSEPTRWRFTEAIEQVCGERTAEVKLETEFRYANAGEALLERGSDADLLVVGARGQGNIVSAILGSVSTRVLHEAPCPVVVVPLLG